jgi:hypothetical protein
MKIKKRYLFLLVIFIAFPFYYNQYGWIWNPWAAPRLVWDEPNPELIGKTFSITVPATYKNEAESIPDAIRNQGIALVITLDSGQPIPNKPYGDYYRIQSSDMLTIQKTYWIRINSWSKGFHAENKFAVVSDKNKQQYIFNFLNFHDTTRPEYIKFKKIESNISS